MIEDYIKSTTAALLPYFPIMDKAVETILNQEVSKYPIFVLTPNEVSIGVLLINQIEGLEDWAIHVSTLEEFNAKNIIRTDRVDDFRKIYKDPEHFFCLFVLELEGSQFVFIPKSETDPKDH